MKKVFKKSYLKKWFDKATEDITNLENAYSENRLDEYCTEKYDLNGQNDWELYELLRHVALDGEFKIETFCRFGAIPRNDVTGYPEQSFNSTDMTRERGLSVADSGYLETWEGRMLSAERDTHKIEVSGIAIGHGSAGEVVIIPVDC